ncbi:Bug family tripartite tricarboxylate transporter substrate binding protein [Alcaligenes faecalis]|uniref:Bug family tripartite tricarboxylate transporter substrate binding protein n=1 Tax=Alcaligenes faecalis TaxID=511 RepID=UPI002933B0E5|nr:tripartite tricarboxylate transporter substrate binding protein [Alcaligenes faecalis]MDV2116131.1 tripartite tricarboxylate transporter substrate binding protein [Alcaligenes faecalis]
MKVWLKLATCCALMLGAQVHAQNQNVTLVIPYPPGGAADQLARVISQEMGTRFDQKVIVENRPGAGAQVAMNVVKNANPNALGTVLFLADSGAYSLNRHMYQRLNYDVATDLIPMTLAAKAPVFLLVNKDSPFKTVQDLVAAGQQQELTYGSPGMGTGTHLLGEMLRKETAARLVHVPYKGAGPALIDTVSGQIDFIFDVLTGSRGFLEEGRLRAIAAATTERSPLRPDTPTIAESGIPNVAFTIWWGISAKAGTPADEVTRLTEQLTAVLNAPEVVQKFVDFGIEIQSSTPQAFAELIESDATAIGPMIQSLQITLD